MNDLISLIEIACKDAHETMVQGAFGDVGLNSMFQVIETAKALYRHVEPERIGGQVIIFKAVPLVDAEPAPPPIEAAADLASLANQTITDLVLEVAIDGRAYIRALGESTPEDLAQRAVVYCYKGGKEIFLAGSESKPIRRYDPSARSQFSVPTLANLREALQFYASENVRESTCCVFEQVWHDTNRIFLKAKPEVQMRRSLMQFLRNRIGSGHDVFPEQNVDESHPVDIRVSPKFNSNRLMLIEIKWLGDSVASDGHITASHRDRRAQEGADQLAQYLDDQRRFAPSHVIHGYYVIIDARRKNLREGIINITRVDGMHYESVDITFHPGPHETRSDFDRPYRMFARPICSD